MPDKGDLGYLIEYLSDIGEGVYKEARMQQQCWLELKAWIDLSGMSLDYFEIKALKRLSNTYAQEFNRSNGKICASPLAVLPEPKKLAQKVESFLSVLRSNK